MEIKFIVNGEPKGKGRPRFYRLGKIVKTYTDSQTISYENRVLMCYKEKLREYNIDESNVLFPKGTFVRLIVNCYFSLTKGDYGKKGLNKSGREKINNQWYDKKSDIDNIVKSVMDGLNGVAYVDDSQIVCLEATKQYTLDQTRVEITLKELDIFTD